MGGKCGSGRLHRHTAQSRRLEDDDDNERLGKNHRTDVRGPMPCGHERSRHDPVEKKKQTAAPQSLRNTDSQC